MVSRRTFLGSVGVGIGTALAGCLASVTDGTESPTATGNDWVAQLGGVRCVNFDYEEHDADVTVIVDSEVVYEDRVTVPASQPDANAVSKGIRLSTPFEPAPYTVRAEMNGQKDQTDGTEFSFLPTEWGGDIPSNPCALVEIKINSATHLEVDDLPDEDGSACEPDSTK